MGSFGTVGSRRKINASPASLQWPRRLSEFGISVNAAPKPPIGTINVIFAAPARTGSCPSRIMLVFCYSDEDSNSMPERVKMNVPLVLSFLDVEKQ